MSSIINEILLQQATDGLNDEQPPGIKIHGESYIPREPTSHIRSEHSTCETCAVRTGAEMMPKPRDWRNDST